MLWMNVAQSGRLHRLPRLRDFWEWFWERRVPMMRPVVAESEEHSDQRMTNAIRDRRQLQARYAALEARVALLSVEQEAMTERERS